MTSRLWSIVLLASVTILGGSTNASAQFETPNRSFHNATSFRLDGKHQTLACEACHLNGQYLGTPKTCFECHWLRRKDDRFQTRLGTQCEQCHRTTSWTAVRWDHAGQSGVPLNADHRQIPCESCHRNSTFKGATVDCVACHQKDYNATKSPNHIAAGFPVACDACHKPSDSSWQTGGPFNHNTVFALVGVHATQSCVACHKNNVYKGTARECVGCHITDYNGTKNPNHIAASFPTTCDSCHRPTDPTWAQGGAFNHNSVFALVGVHSTQPCAACHKNSVYKGTPRDCVGCHITDYNGTKNPNHVAASFPTTCDSCHRPTDPTWGQGAAFNHNSVFALVGVHATQNCVACHKNNVYRGTPRDCVGCHIADYNGTNNPSHAAAGFPTSCDSCHKPTDPTWLQGVFNHSPFRLTSSHNVACAQCHTTPNNFAVFSCTVCHSRSSTDSEHRGRTGYIYDSNACYSCHPTGRSN